MKVFTVADMERESWAAMHALFRQVSELFPPRIPGRSTDGEEPSRGRLVSGDRAAYGKRLGLLSGSGVVDLSSRSMGHLV